MKIEGVRIGILTSLAAGPQHGYGILQDLDALSNGRVTPPVGSLYRVIDALQRDNFIDDAGSEVVDGRFRRYYQLTPAGHAELIEAADTMVLLAKQARTRTAKAAKKDRPVKAALT